MTRMGLILVISLWAGSAISLQFAPGSAHLSGRATAGASCRMPDASTTERLHYLRLASMSPRKVAWRTATKVPLLVDTTALVDVVSDSVLCARALTAYNTIVLPDSAATEIELLRADTVYVATHPTVRSGEFIMSYVFDSTFQWLGAYLQ